MVEPPEERQEESFFCGPPGKLQLGQLLLYWMGRPKSNVDREKEGRRLGNGSEVGSSWVGVGMGVLQGQDYVSSTNFWLLRV